jgi:LysM repeat protein
LEYVTRIGDNYFNIAGTMGVDLDTMRKDNALWHLENLPPGLRLTLSTNWKGTHEVHAVQAGETLHTIAENLKSDPWRIIWDNQIWNQNLETGMVLRVRKAPPKPTYLVHRVSSGENLGVIARRYGTTVRAIQAANTLGQRTLIRIGQRLRIPTVK